MHYLFLSQVLSKLPTKKGGHENHTDLEAASNSSGASQTVRNKTKEKFRFLAKLCCGVSGEVKAEN